MTKNIVLIGMMGCGKTTVGGLLAQYLRRPLTDTDLLIEQRQGRSIPDIFASDGEDGFRALELTAGPYHRLRRRPAPPGRLHLRPEKDRDRLLAQPGPRADL